MRMILKAGALLLVAGLVNVPLTAQTEPGIPQPAGERALEKIRQEGGSLIRDDAAQPLNATSRKGEQLRDHLEDARKSYLSGNPDKSVQSLNHAVVILRGQAGRLVGTGRDGDLRDAIGQLEKLSGRLEKKEVKSVDEFKSTYSDVYRNLAWYHYMNAERMRGLPSDQRQPSELEANHPDSATRDARPDASARSGDADRDINYEIDRSVSYYEDYSRESGAELSQDDRTVMQKLRSWTGKAIAGTGWATGEAGDTLNSWGRRMNEYGNDMRTRANEGHTTSTAPKKDKPHKDSTDSDESR